MSTNLDVSKLIEFYNDQLWNSLLPFWLNHAIDYEDGGYYTCFDNSGRILLSQDKYTWSQGRLVWIFSKLSCMHSESIQIEDRKKFLKLAEQGADFLMKYCLLENGTCTFIMDKKGGPKVECGNYDFDTSIYADCFVICGLAKFAEASGNKKAMNFAIKLYASVTERIESNCFKTDPYPIPEGYKSHGIPMILLNTTYELEKSICGLRDEQLLGLVNNLKTKMADYISEIVDIFIQDNGVLLEMVNPDHKSEETLIGGYVNPGHSIEDMWFLIHAAKELGEEKYIETACKVVKKTFEIGWDDEFGGLFLFVDKNGGVPKGRILKIKDDTMIEKITQDWNSKLWWTHSEALYTTLLCYEMTGDNDFIELYWKVHEYTFKVFPNPDKSIGEWIQIRDRMGNPISKVVALPVKDPFHIIRNVILNIELLYRLRN